MLLLLLLALPDIPDEDRLLVQARRGNQQAIADLYEAFFDPVYQFIRWRVDDPQAAEDLTSEVFIKFLNALQGQNAPRQSVRGWLFRVARNVLHDHYQRAGKAVGLEDDLAVPAEDEAEALLLQSLEIEQIRHGLRTLAPEQQEVLLLRFGDMLSLEDTAESMGKSISAVKSLQFRAIDALRRSLGEAKVHHDTL